MHIQACCGISNSMLHESACKDRGASSEVERCNLRKDHVLQSLLVASECLETTEHIAYRLPSFFAPRHLPCRQPTESMLNVRRHRIPGYRNARHSMCNKSISLRASPRLNLRHSARASTYPQSLRCHAPAGGSCVTTAVIKFSLNTGSHAGGSGSSRQVWSLVHCARLYALELGRSCDTTLQHTARVRSASTSLDGMPSDNLDEHAIDNESSMQLLSYHTTQQTPFDQASTFVPPASCR